MRQTMCAYGNCQEMFEDCPESQRVSIVLDGARPKFCSREHALLWLQHDIDIRKRNGAAWQAKEKV